MGENINCIYVLAVSDILARVSTSFVQSKFLSTEIYANLKCVIILGDIIDKISLEKSKFITTLNHHKPAHANSMILRFKYCVMKMRS